MINGKVIFDEQQEKEMNEMVEKIAKLSKNQSSGQNEVDDNSATIGERSEIYLKELNSFSPKVDLVISEISSYTESSNNNNTKEIELMTNNLKKNNAQIKTNIDEVIISD